MQLAIVLVVMTMLGIATCVWLRTGRYRRAEEIGPLPGHWWVVPATPFVAGLVWHALAGHPWPVLLPYLALVPAGAVLAAVDADVHRLPNAVTLPLVPVEAVLLTGASTAAGDWGALQRAGLAALLVGGGFVLLAFFFFGRFIGMGDAKLMVSLAATLAWLGWTHLVLGIWFGFLLGGLVALGLLLSRRATKGTHLAFGPYLVAGALLAVGLG